MQMHVDRNCHIADALTSLLRGFQEAMLDQQVQSFRGRGVFHESR